MSGETKEARDLRQGLGAVDVTILNLLISKKVLTREDVVAELKQKIAEAKQAGSSEDFIASLRFVEATVGGHF